MMKTAVGRFRFVGMAEGISFLVLLGIAMPLKYMAGLPEAVKFFGWLHGILFVLYLITLANAAIVRRWSFFRIVGGLIASLLPFGPFVFDARLRRDS